ncbi:uncharacterized protein LOC142576028 [Dermacentor variabilis]|uniref:uncharacterized protein LOC142576028 n=1 Tax=Dermacentor variabilis TaxID=34621 RepID=UPI003F5C0D0F
MNSALLFAATCLLLLASRRVVVCEELPADVAEKAKKYFQCLDGSDDAKLKRVQQAYGKCKDVAMEDMKNCFAKHMGLSDKEAECGFKLSDQ